MPTAFVASYGEGEPVIGILAEYDALPGLSQKRGSYKKEPEKPGEPGHGCGHNIFGAGCTGAAIAVKRIMENHNLEGTVKLFGCPAEETLIGKVFMAKSGCFDGLDAAITWHPGSKNQVSLGSSQAMNSFTVEFYGKTAHAAADPWDGRSALDAVEMMDFGINLLREHVRPTARIHYVITSGGKAPNVVPDYAKVWYYVRDKDRKNVDENYERIMKIVKGAAIATETTFKVNLITGVHSALACRTIAEVLYKNLKYAGPPVFTDEEQEFAKKIQKELGVPEKGLSKKIEEFKKPEGPSGGSTDVAEVSWITPTAQFNAVSWPLGAPGHSWAIVTSVGSSIGHKGAITASKVIALSVLDLLLDKSIIMKAQKEWREKTKGMKYKSPVPADKKPPVEN